MLSRYEVIPPSLIRTVIFSNPLCFEAVNAADPYPCVFKFDSELVILAPCADQGKLAPAAEIEAFSVAAKTTTSNGCPGSPLDGVTVFSTKKDGAGGFDVIALAYEVNPVVTELSPFACMVMFAEPGK